MRCLPSVSPLLLPLRAVAGLGGLLGRAPPGLVGHVPVDGGLQALGEVGVRRPPAELALQLRAVDGVAAVVAGAVGDPVEVLGVAAHGLEDHAQDRDVVLLAVGSDEVGLPHLALREDVPDGRGVVLGVDPVADVLAAAVELGAHAVDDVGDLARDELLHVLVGAVVVGAVGDRGAQAVGAGPGAHEHVGAGLGARVRAARVVRRLLGELGGVVERQVAVDLVGGDVVVADAVLADGLQEAEGALDVGAQEGLRVGDGVVVVALGGVVHDRVVAGDDPIEQLRVADVTDDELDPVLGQPRDVLGVAGVGQLVQDGDVHVGVVVDHVVDEVAADEAAAARDDDVLGGEGLLCHVRISLFLVLARAVDDLAGGDLLEVPAVDRLAVGLRGLLELGGRDPAVLPGDLLGDGHGQVLGVLHGADELRGLVQALHGAGVQPRVAAAQGDHGQRPLLQVHLVERGDLQLAARGGLHLVRLGGHVARVEVQAGDGVGALGALGLLLDGDRPPLAVELHDAEALGVVHVVAEDRGPPRLRVLHGARQVARQAVAVEDVVAEHQRARLAVDEVLADGEGLRQAVRARLLGVGEVHAVARAVPEQALEVGEVGRRGDDQDVPDARQHEGGQRVVDHGLVVDRQQLLGGHERERVQAGAGPAGEDDAFHWLWPFFSSDPAAGAVSKKARAAVDAEGDKLDQIALPKELGGDRFDEPAPFTDLTCMHEVVRMRFEKETDGAVAGKLLGWRQVVRVIDLGTRLVSDLHTRGDKLGGHEHVLVGVDMIESAAFEICGPSIGRTGVRCEESFDAVFRKVRLAAHRGNVGIVKLAHELLETPCIRLGQLPTSYERD